MPNMLVACPPLSLEQELENEHNGQKQTYDAAMSQFEARTSALEGEVRGRF